MGSSGPDRTFCKEPSSYNKGLIISSTVSPGSTQGFVQLLNDQDQLVVLKKGNAVGIATEIDAVIPKSESENVQEVEFFISKVSSSIHENTNTSTRSTS